VLVVQRTGWGKSAVYFLTTHLLRSEGLGPTLLISPLLALMRNQIDAAERLGLRCQTVNSASNTTVRELEGALQRDEVDLLVISPERLANPEFADTIVPLVGRRPGLIVIDEVHCISDWGHDFRPDYRRIGRIVDGLAGSSVPVLGCTATANDRVVQDVAVQLGAELTTFRGPLRRDGLALSTLRLDRQAERLAWLAEVLPEMDGSGIVYCLTVRDVQNVADWLRSQGIEAEAYFGSLGDDARLEAERRLQANEIKVLVATTALGMGYDKPDLGFVVHFQSPGHRWPTTSRSVAQAERSSAVTACCCAAWRTSRSRTGSSSRRSPPNTSWPTW
jgi:ATP-dependent DNA helicase RecQ